MAFSAAGMLVSVAEGSPTRGPGLSVAAASVVQPPYGAAPWAAGRANSVGGCVAAGMNLGRES